MSTAVLMPGCSVKTKKLAGARAEISGYCVRHTSTDEPDCVGDFFTRDSDLGEKYIKSLPLMIDHGHGEFGKEILADLTFRRDEKGLFVRGQLDLMNPRHVKVYEVGRAGNWKWSTSSLAQHIERKAIKVGDKTVFFLRRWFAREASLTAAACDAQTSAQAIPVKHFKPVPLQNLLAMTPAERFEWEKLKTQTHLQRALDDGIALSEETIRSFGLIGNDWLQTQARLHAGHQADRNCGCHQIKVAGVESMPADRYERARRGRMRIPCGW